MNSTATCDQRLGYACKVFAWMDTRLIGEANAWSHHERNRVDVLGVEAELTRQRGICAQAFGVITRAIANRRVQVAVHPLKVRVDAVLTHLPELMWIVILSGAVISLCASFFFSVADVRLHAILVTLLAIFIGLVIFLTLAFDRPFIGDLGISADPYQLIYDQLMKQ